MASTKDYVKLHFIVFLWGFSAILGKLVSIPAIEMVFYRSILATIGMGIVILVVKESLNVTPKDFFKLMLIGFIVALHWLSFFASARVSNVSVSLVGFATNSLWTALLEPIFNRTKFKRLELFLGSLVITGLYIIFSFDFQYKLGLVLGILTGLTSALFSVLNSKMVKRIAARTITFYEMLGVILGTGLFMLGYSFFTNTTLQLTPTYMDWLYIATLAGVCSVYAYTTSVELMKKISVFLIQLTLNLEPLYGIIIAVILFGDKEKMNSNFYIGTAIILCAVFSYPFLKNRFDKTVLLD